MRKLSLAVFFRDVHRDLELCVSHSSNVQRAGHRGAWLFCTSLGAGALLAMGGAQQTFWNLLVLSIMEVS